MNEQIEVNLTDLIMNPDTQIRVKTDDRVVRRYADAMRAEQEFPPVTVARVTQGGTLRAFTLIDGWHRVMACKALGRYRMAAVVVDAKPHEYRWLAAQGNLTHGHPLTNAEKRAVFRAYVQAGQHRNDKGRLKSCREMTSELGGKPSRATIPVWMRRDFPKVFREMKREGLVEGHVGGHRSADLDAVHARLASDALDQFWVSFRGVKDTEERLRLLEELGRVSRDATLTVTGRLDLPVPSEDPF